MKTCTKCKQEKSVSEFYKNGKYLSSYCKKCHNIWNKEYYRKPENKRIISKKQKEYFKNNKLKQRYGITSQDWDKIFEKQKGRCAICSKHQSELDISLCVDHSHKTGKVRGLLCAGCNAKLATVEDKQFCEIAQGYLNNGGIN